MCQHFAKKLSQKQKQKSALSKAKKKVNAQLSSQLRNKKTNCPLSFTLTIQIPTKASTEKNAESQPHQLSHCGILKTTFDHNHSINVAHTLSFRDVSTDTKWELTDLFEMGHSASSARHAHERLLHEAETNKQVMLADRAQNPNPQDVYRLYDKWSLGSYGSENGKSLFERLQQAIDTYNGRNEIWMAVEGRQCYSGMMLVKDKLVKYQIVMMRTLSCQQKKNNSQFHTHDFGHMHTDYEKSTSTCTTIKRCCLY